MKTSLWGLNKQTLKPFLCTTTALHLRVPQLGVAPLTLRKDWGTRGSGPGARSAKMEIYWVESLQVGMRTQGVEVGLKPVVRSGPAILCVGRLAKALGVKLLPLLLLQHSKLLGLVWWRQDVGQGGNAVCWNDQACEINKNQNELKYITFAILMPCNYVYSNISGNQSFNLPTILCSSSVLRRTICILTLAPLTEARTPSTFVHTLSTEPHRT